MRFYLDLPLVVGYTLMATAACLGMLQFAAARGGYRGLSLFVTDPKIGKRIGAALVVAAVLGYVMFAPEILTPGPAGSEVALMFSFCALVALGLTLLGTDLRLRRLNRRLPHAGQAFYNGDLRATLYCPARLGEQPRMAEVARFPAIVILPDPSGFVVLPAPTINAFTKAGMAALVVETTAVFKSGSPLSRHSLKRCASDAAQLLSNLPGLDTERIGLLGLGLSGDATLAAAPRDARFAATIALSPLVFAPVSPGAAARGLDWLHELSYTQVWRWRRRSPRLRQTATRLLSEEPAYVGKPGPDRRACHSSSLFALRGSATSFTELDAPDDSYFTLLEKERVEQLVIRWFRDALVQNR